MFVEVVKSPLYDATGKIVGVQGMFWDVTERYRAAEALRASEARLNEAERLAHLGSWEAESVSLKDPSQNPLSWSDETFRIFGYEPGAVAVTHDLFSNGVHPEDRSKVWGAVQAALRERKPYSAEHRIARPDGSERVVLEQAELVCDPATGQPLKFIGTVQDITERRRLQKQIEGVSRMRESLLRPGDLLGKLRCITDTVVTVFDADFARIWITRPGDLCESGCIHAQATEGPHVCRFRDRCLHLLSSSGRTPTLTAKNTGGCLLAPTRLAGWPPATTRSSSPMTSQMIRGSTIPPGPTSWAWSRSRDIV
jgi:PAS domain S-box-containing protein